MDALFSPLFESNLWREPFGRSIFCTESDDRAMRNLFANGEQGGYWPADPQYSFEDSAGTTAASVDGVVGLRYDNSKNLSLNTPVLAAWQNGYTTPLGSFSSTASSSFSGTLPAGGASRNIVGNISATVGKFIRIIFSIATTNVLSASINFSSGAYAGLASGALVPLNGLFNVVFFVPATTINILLIYSGSSGGQITVTDFVASEIAGNHALQATTGNKPYLRVTPTTGKYWYDSNTATGAMNVTFSGALGSACTIATVTPEGVSILEDQTVGATYNIAPPYGYNSDVLIINRALTAAEKALVTRVMGRNVPTLGSELVTNGGFSSTTGWKSANGTVQNDAYMSIVGGAMRVTNTEVTATDLRFRSTALLSYVGALFVKVNIKYSGTTGRIRVAFNASTIDSGFGTSYYVEDIALGFYGIKNYAVISSQSHSPVVRSAISYPAGDYMELNSISVKGIL